MSISALTSLPGLSPRLRGNRLHPRLWQLRIWSIPAPAGEPVVYIAPVALPAVYPRACGGTLAFPPSAYSREGLSPRLRGNLQTERD